MKGQVGPADDALGDAHTACSTQQQPAGGQQPAGAPIFPSCCTVAAAVVPLHRHRAHLLRVLHGVDQRLAVQHVAAAGGGAGGGAGASVSPHCWICWGDVAVLPAAALPVSSCPLLGLLGRPCCACRCRLALTPIHPSPLLPGAHVEVVAAFAGVAVQDGHQVVHARLGRLAQGGGDQREAAPGAAGEGSRGSRSVAGGR